MDRRAFISTLASGLLAAPLAAEAQQVTTFFRVGLLSGGPRGEPTTRSPFRERLHELGWMEGKNLILELRYAEGKLERLPDLAAELVQLKMDVIVTVGTNAAAAAKNATSTIPIVFLSGDPVRAGLVRNLARPGGNITGLSMVASELYVKRLQILKEAVPWVKRVTVLYDPANPSFATATQDTAGAIRSLGIETDRIESGLRTISKPPSGPRNAQAPMLSFSSPINCSSWRVAGW